MRTFVTDRQTDRLTDGRTDWRCWFHKDSWRVLINSITRDNFANIPIFVVHLSRTRRWLYFIQAIWLQIGHGVNRHPLRVQMKIYTPFSPLLFFYTAANQKSRRVRDNSVAYGTSNFSKNFKIYFLFKKMDLHSHKYLKF